MGKKNNIDWSKSPFYFDKNGDNEHFPASHWSPFVDDVETILNQLAEIFDSAVVKSGYADFYPSERLSPENWSSGFYLIWPDQNQGIMLTIRTQAQENHMSALFPYHHLGMQHKLTLEQVNIFANGLEAQIEAKLGSAIICFYDSLYLINRNHYEANKTYEFILTAIAYHAQPAQNQEFKIKNSKKLMRSLEKLDLDYPIEEEMTISTEGAAICIPLPDGDEDEYHYSGTITKVKLLDEFLGQTGWWIDVTLMRDDNNNDKAIDFRLMVTKRVWMETEPPCIGQDITGTFWLQGYLWNAR